MCVALACWGTFSMEDVQADVADAESLSSAIFGYFSEFSVTQDSGWLQCMVATDQYILCIENNETAADPYQPDTILAFYKNDHDKDGNPVEQYGYATSICETDFEHANGAAYNPYTNEIVIVPGPLNNKSNKGNIFILDADTLRLKETVNVGGGVRNYTCVGYSELTRQWILQGNIKTDYTFYITDEDFNIVDTIADYEYDTVVQDFCVSGDYILSSSWSPGENQNYINVFSVSQRRFLAQYPLELSDSQNRTEMEGICELFPGRLMVGSALMDPRRIRLDIAQVPALVHVETSVEEGTITDTNMYVNKNSDYTVEFETPRKHYELTQLLINGKETEIDPTQRSYTFENIQDDTRIHAVFSKIPKYTITTCVENGTISETKKRYRDKSYTVEYAPNEHYELDKVLIDGEEVDTKDIETAYNFGNIQGNHEIQVIYKEIPSWKITTSVVNGTVTDSIAKAYRDTDQTIEYAPDEDYMLLYAKVDGEYVSWKKYNSSYTFKNIQGPHEIEIYYMWKYIPYIVVGGFITLILVIYFTVMHFRRKRKRIRK